ncbi:MAG: OmpH family outer membrane protein [Paracoccaceae bacterium]|nr:OmpH family outer membrane protein [Paracoccaceae bacterium]
MWGPALAAVVALGLTAAPALAQDRLVVPSPVLTIDQEALFERSAFGKRAQADFEAASAALAAENRRIEADLEAEERTLTAERPGMDSTEFRDLAAAFDARVVEIRRTQDQKARDLGRRPEEARQEFFRAALPVLTELVRERGAVAILDSRAVILSAEAIDITEEAIGKIDAALGDGAQAPEAPGASQDAPQQQP